jgi:hypothetical protein
MSLQQLFDNACRGDWKAEEASECGCRGRGYFLSDVDTWHYCSLHGSGKPHPEDDEWKEEGLEVSEISQPAIVTEEVEDDWLPF